MTRISVVILNFNGEDLLRKFLPSVIRHSADAGVIVADNGSTDQSLVVLKNEFPQVSVIALSENYGFCGGYNRALRQIDADYFVLLNSDVEVTAGWLAPMKNILDSDASVGAVQPKILSWSEKEKFEYAGAAGGLIDALGYPFCRGRIFDHVEIDDGQYDDESEIFWATGACMMVRATAFNKLGGFDEGLFAHMEEIDLCWKMHRANINVFYTGRSKVYHFGAGTLGYDNPRKTYLNFRNGLILIFRHFDNAELMWKLPLRMLLDWVASLTFLLKGKFDASWSVFRAHWHFLRDFPTHRRTRSDLHKQYPTYPRRNIKPGLILYDYYFRGKRTFKAQ